jgi:hypothetical protein
MRGVFLLFARSSGYPKFQRILEAGSCIYEYLSSVFFFGLGILHLLNADFTSLRNHPLRLMFGSVKLINNGGNYMYHLL